MKSFSKHMKKGIMMCLLSAAFLSLAACGKKEAPAAPEETIVETETEAAPEYIITGGASMDEAQELEFNQLYHGEYAEGECWVSFTTGDKEAVPYKIALENLTAGSEDLDGYIIDAEENVIRPTEYCNGDTWHSMAVRAKNDGKLDTAMFDELQPNTTYYLKLQGKSKAVFSLLITDPEQDAFDMMEGRTVLKAGEELVPAANQENAPVLTANTRFMASYEDGYQWIAFTTGSVEEDPYKITEPIPYRITIDNLTLGSEGLDAYLVDEDGDPINATEIRNGDKWYSKAICATQDGTADTALFAELDPNSTYYLKMQGDSKVTYSIRITDPQLEPFDAAAGRTVIGAGEALVPAANQDAAPLLTMNARYQGTYEDGYQWIAFKTADVVEDPNKIADPVPYRVTLENQTVGSEPLEGYLVDEYGNPVKATAIGNGDPWHNMSVRAKQDGTADTALFENLDPNTTYYLRIQSKTRSTYVLTINGPETGEGSEGFVTANDGDTPGTSQSYALSVPLQTTVTAKYNDGYSWLAFTTNELEGVKYYVTMVNCTVGSEPLDGYVVDKGGNSKKAAELRNGDPWVGKSVSAKMDGRADTAIFEDLDPNTTYYIRVQGKNKAVYSFRVSCPDALRDNAFSTSSTLTEAVGELPEDVKFYTGTNQDNATLIKKNIRYHGSYNDGYAWVSFTTGSKEGSEYSVTLENLTVGSEPLEGYLVDEYGMKTRAVKIHNGDNWNGLSVKAKEDGTADTAAFDNLMPDTTYYLMLTGKTRAEYLLTIGAPEEEEAGNTLAQEEVVFEVPFELNDTQVRFKGDSDAFADPESAEEALAPVAEIILAHPGHPILLAGTTAEVGDQASCVALSDLRAAAVKKALVEKFNVPEDQLITVGLGFADDPFERGQDIVGGKIVETEAAKNRRVVVIDAESDMAKQILK